MNWVKRSSNIVTECLRANKIRSRKYGLFGGSSKNSAVEKLIVPESPLETVDLKNGMRLISECVDSCVTTVGFVVPAGSMHEMPDERGASFFMERYLFRRTRCKTREEITQIVEQTGAKLGALSLRDMFVFYGSVPSYDIEPIVELLADVIINGITCDDDVAAGTSLILKELEEMEDDHEKVAMDYLVTMAYQGNELGRSVYPKTSVVKSMHANTIENFRKRLFNPDLMTMICTGGTSFTDIQSLASEYFLGSSDQQCPVQGQCTPKNWPCSPNFRYTGCELRFRDDDQPLGHVAIAVEGPGFCNCEDHCTLTVAKEIVGCWDLTFGGSGNNSPYIAGQAFNSDMCHMYRSFNIGWANTGLWGCYFTCEKMQLEDMMWMVQNEWMRLCGAITSKEVERAVNQCKTREILRVDNSIDRFFDIGNSLYRRGHYETFEQRLARYERVTVEKVREVANKYIYDQCPVFVAVGAVDNLPMYDSVRSYMYRLRH